MQRRGYRRAAVAGVVTSGTLLVLLLFGGAWAAPLGPPVPISASDSCAIPFAACYILLSTSSGSHGNKVTISGYGFYPGDQFNAYFWNGASAPQPIGLGSIGATGGFTATFHVPNDPVGAYEVYVTDLSGDNQSAGFALTHLVASPHSGAPKSVFSASGSGFAPSATVNFTIAGKNASTSAACRTNSRGVFAGCLITVPKVASGGRTLIATAGTTVARIAFTVT